MSASYSLLGSVCPDSETTDVEQYVEESSGVMTTALADFKAASASSAAPSAPAANDAKSPIVSPRVFLLPPPGTKTFTYIPYFPVVNLHNSIAEEKSNLDFSQDAILKKLNKYLTKAKKTLLDTGGYCHGFALYWLYLNSQKVGHHYYEQVKRILTCPDNELLQNSSLFENFITNINRGQNPGEAIKSKFSTVSQDDVCVILNGKAIVPKIELSNLTKANVSEQLTAQVKDGCYLVISAWVKDKNKSGDEVEEGHTVAVICEAGKYYLFDANFPDNKPKEFNSIEALNNQIWNCFQMITSLPLQKLKFEMDVMTPPAYVPPASRSPQTNRAGFFKSANSAVMPPADTSDLFTQSVLQALGAPDLSAQAVMQPINSAMVVPA